jgi:sigma-B regulation protein RsbU (phosphoserine phosphatase)
LKIIVAEDDRVSMKLICRHLERWGYDFEAVENGREALSACCQAPFSILLTDWEMPVMSGLELIEEVRKLKTMNYVYIVMLTANNEKERLIEGMQAGADDFVGKPFDFDELHVRLKAGERIVELEKDLFDKNKQLVSINDRMRRDLQAAADIQRSLLPSAPPNNPRITTAWRFDPCDELAGDSFNVFHLDEHHIGFYLLDVSGHGVPAALLAVTLSRVLSPTINSSSIIKQRLSHKPWYRVASAAEVATELNQRFQIDNRNAQYFTMVYGKLDLRNLELDFVLAGHPEIILLRDKEPPQLLGSNDLAIGFLKNYQYKADSVKLKQGDRLVLYSDGITESKNANNEEFGQRNLMKLLAQSRDQDLNQSTEFVLKELDGWRGQLGKVDDISLLALEIG